MESLCHELIGVRSNVKLEMQYLVEKRVVGDEVKERRHLVTLLKIITTYPGTGSEMDRLSRSRKLIKW